MINKKKIFLTLSVSIFIAMTIYIAIFWAKLPTNLPVRFNADGTPSLNAHKFFFLLYHLLLGFITGTAYLIQNLNDNNFVLPKLKSKEKTNEMYSVVIFEITFMMFILENQIIKIALNELHNFNTSIPTIFFVIITGTIIIYHLFYSTSKKKENKDTQQ